METISEAPLSILNIIYSIVKGDSFPLKCRLRPRDLILRTMQDWSEIESSLNALEGEGLVSIVRSGTFEVSIRDAGILKCTGGR